MEQVFKHIKTTKNKVAYEAPYEAAVSGVIYLEKRRFPNGNYPKELPVSIPDATVEGTP
jgi:hypothetical protein